MAFGHVTDGAAHRELRIADRREDLMPGDRRDIFMRLGGNRRARETTAFREEPLQQVFIDRQSVVWGKSGSVRLDLGGRRIHQKKTSNADTALINADNQHAKTKT